jgi:hypothetical protein
VIGFTLTLLFPKEISNKYFYKDNTDECDITAEQQSLLSDSAESSSPVNIVVADADNQIIVATRLSLCNLFNHEMLRKCILPTAMMITITCNHSVMVALLMLLLPAPVANGGFGMLPRLMGTIIALSAVVNISITLVLYPPMQVRYDLLKLFRIGLVGDLIAILLLPLLQAILNYMAVDTTTFIFICLGVSLGLSAHFIAFSFTTTSAQILVCTLLSTCIYIY